MGTATSMCVSTGLDLAFLQTSWKIMLHVTVGLKRTWDQKLALVQSQGLSASNLAIFMVNVEDILSLDPFWVYVSVCEVRHEIYALEFHSSSIQTGLTCLLSPVSSCQL